MNISNDDWENEELESLPNVKKLKNTFLFLNLEIQFLKWVDMCLYRKKNQLMAILGHGCSLSEWVFLLWKPGGTWKKIG